MNVLELDQVKSGERDFGEGQPFEMSFLILGFLASLGIILARQSNIAESTFGFWASCAVALGSGYPIYRWIYRHISQANLLLPLWWACYLGIGLIYSYIIVETGGPAKLIGDAPARKLAIEHVGSIIESGSTSLLFYSYPTNAPIADLLYWVILSSFGPDISLLPWQITIHLSIAAATLAICSALRVSERAAAIAFWTILLFPGYAFLAMHFHRSNLITLSLLLTALGAIRLVGKQVLLSISLPLGFLLMAGLRAIWLPLVLLWSCSLFLFLHSKETGKRLSRVLALLFVLLVGLQVFLFATEARFDFSISNLLPFIQSNFVKQIGRGGQVGSDSIRLSLTDLTGLRGLIGMPTKFVIRIGVSSIGVWPWVPYDLPHGTVLFFFIPDACLRFTILWSILQFWASSSSEYSIPRWNPAVLLGLLVYGAGLIHIGNFWRYTSPAFPLLTPWFAVVAERREGMIWKGMFWAAEGIILLHLLLFLVRGRV